MTTILYPTPDQVQLAIRWWNSGPGALDPDNGTPDRRRGYAEKNQARTGNLTRVRDLIFRLSLPYQYETMRTEILYRPVTRIDPRLLDQIMKSLRLYGYVHETGRMQLDGVTPLYAITPLTGYQLHILRLYAAGQNTRQIGDLFGVDPARINSAMRKARRDTGLEADVRDQLMAYVYAAGWLPSFREQRALVEDPAPPVGKPYRRVSGPISVPVGVTP